MCLGRMTSVRCRGDKRLTLQSKCVSTCKQTLQWHCIFRGCTNMVTQASGQSHNFKSKQVDEANVFALFSLIH